MKRAQLLPALGTFRKFPGLSTVGEWCGPPRLAEGVQNPGRPKQVEFVGQNT